MRIYYSSGFAKQYKKLPLSVKKLAEEKEKVFRKDPYDLRLKTHKLIGKLSNLWAFSIDYKHRIIFEFKQKDVVWFHFVGGHEIYQKE